MSLLLEKHLFRAASRLATLPKSHPLHPIIRRAKRHYVKRHPAPIHHLLHRTGIFDTQLPYETIDVIRRRSTFEPTFSVHIPPDKQQALEEAKRRRHAYKVRVYSDGSGIDGQIGAAAALYINGRIKGKLFYHLGKATDHTVYEAELVGVLLAQHLLRSINQPFYRATIGLDNQAVILATQNQQPKPAHYLLDAIHSESMELMKKQSRMHTPTALRQPDWQPDDRGVFDLSIHWTPGHMDFTENEDIDGDAKTAAQGFTSPANKLPALLRKHPLPRSLSAARQANLADLKKRHTEQWKKSKRYTHRMKFIDPTMPSPKFLKSISNLTRPQAAIITQLRTGHAPLNEHLHRIKRSATPNCPHCGPGFTESVRHFLIQCRHHSRARYQMYRKLKRNAYNIEYLLQAPKAFPHVIKFIRDSNRLSNIFGDLETHPPKEQEAPNAAPQQ
ncbi:hypothetical protein NLI96_g12952 [Meripilus lineatus]|uniref:RNase H type-1 domain-containing protein n=1 Tax=Meripilus lineatus TaxID=2056292 RepID=A0AAD5Y9E2_9APHY|nr:hypothetical protein NLI96_g12952 [Physisporinus lineatus]